MLLALACSGFALIDVVSGQPAKAPSPAVEPQTRGPIHEAFAEPIVYDPLFNPVVSRQPPAGLKELPPGVKPAGANVVWLPGYWAAWDDDREDFLWVSGVWRVPPPGARWIPGYWCKAAGGCRWTPGFWAASTAHQIRYQPAPPQSIESGPASPSPSENHFYIPGHWAERNGDYVWQAGYWAQIKPGWVWEPAHYVATALGSIFVPGRWDYPLAQRGLLFAPVIVNAEAAARPGFHFTPDFVINATALTSNLFVRPRCNHYYFGDYYGDDCARQGYQPWYAFHDSGKGCVPQYVYSRWLYGRSDAPWDAEMRAAYRRRFAHADARPPRNLAALEKMMGTPGGGEGLPLVLPLKQLVFSKASPLALVQVNEGSRSRAKSLAEHFGVLIGERMKTESGAAGTLKFDSAATVTPTLHLPQFSSALQGVFGIGASLTDAVGPSLPGVSGRVLPGSSDRVVPGLRGRVVPGVEQVSPVGGIPGRKNALPGAGGGRDDD